MTKEELIETMCEEYCKKPLEYLNRYDDPAVAQDEMWNEACNNCPLLKIGGLNEKSIQD